MTPRKVLIIENLKDVADSVRMLLELWGHQVRVASNGLDGVATARDWEPAVVLCDIGLPGLNGFRVVEVLRWTGARLIAISGYESKEFRRLAVESGFQEVLARTADPNELVRLLA